MNDAARAGLDEVILRDARTAIRCLAAVEKATVEGRLNIAKVLRATALSARTRALTAERLAMKDGSSLDAFASLYSANSASVAELEALANDPSLDDEERNMLQGVLHASSSLTSILDATAASLQSSRDVLESAVAQLLWGCEECGLHRFGIASRYLPGLWEHRR